MQSRGRRNAIVGVDKGDIRQAGMLRGNVVNVHRFAYTRQQSRLNGEECSHRTKLREQDADILGGRSFWEAEISPYPVTMRVKLTW